MEIINILQDFLHPFQLALFDIVIQHKEEASIHPSIHPSIQGELNPIGTQKGLQIFFVS
jgi:hypothetical protein